MLSRRSFVALTGALSLAACSLPEVPPVEFNVELEAMHRALISLEEFADRYGYRALGPVEFADVFRVPDINAGSADYRAWRSELSVASATDAPRRFMAMFQPAGWLALSYRDLGEIAADLARVLRTVDGVRVDQTYYN